jgi:hypothetical protein
MWPYGSTACPPALVLLSIVLLKSPFTLLHLAPAVTLDEFAHHDQRKVRPDLPYFARIGMDACPNT